MNDENMIMLDEIVELSERFSDIYKNGESIQVIGLDMSYLQVQLLRGLEIVHSSCLNPYVFEYEYGDSVAISVSYKTVKFFQLFKKDGLEKFKKEFDYYNEISCGEISSDSVE